MSPSCGYGEPPSAAPMPLCPAGKSVGDPRGYAQRRAQGRSVRRHALSCSVRPLHTTARRDVELRIAPEDALLVERDAARRGEVRGDARALAHALGQCAQVRQLALELACAVREGVADALEHLEQRQVDVAAAASEDPALTRQL